jgi:hypothetical protein
MSLNNLESERIWKSNVFKVGSVLEVPIRNVPFDSFGCDFHGVIGSYGAKSSSDYENYITMANEEMPNGSYILTNGSQRPNIENIPTIHARLSLLKQFPGVMSSMFRQLGIDPRNTAFVTDSKTESIAAVACRVGYIFHVTDPSLNPHPVEALWRKSLEPIIFKLGRTALNTTRP